ncbi:MAG: hypothetical protein GEV08_20230 [Acidimicrobiia bacterium]|nr:hypothetical protein [Acidimicrobiia bacterium]
MAAARQRRARLAPVALVVVLFASLWSIAAAGASPALAQEAPPTTAATSTSTTPSTWSGSSTSPSSVSPSSATVPPTATTLPPEPAPVNRLVPGGQYGDFPLDAYDYMYSTNEDGKDDFLGVDIPGVNLNLPVPTSQEQGRRTVTGMIASWAFAATVTIVKLALLIVGWAFDFPLLSLLADLVRDAVNHLEGSFIGPSGLRAGVAVLAAFIAGWYLLTARLIHGLREALIGVVMIALAGMMVSNIDRYYQAASEFGAGISSVIVGLAGDSQGNGVDAVQTGMAQALVAEPWALLNYGNPLEGACAQAGREVLARGPHGTSGTPRQIMRDAGCREEAAFNQNPTTERAIDAGLLFLGVLPAALFMILVAFSLLIAQFRLAIAFVIAPGALLLGAIASTRHLAGRWALFAVKAMLGIIAPVVVLSAMALIDLLILTGIDFNVTVGGVRIDLIAKLVLINAANLALWMKRRVVADGIYKATTVKADRALVRAGIPTAGPETPKPLAARLDKQHVMPGVRDPVHAMSDRTRTAVGGARAGTAKLATGAATVAAGPAARGSMAAAAVLGVAQKTAVATGGNTTDAEGRRTGTATGGGSRGGRSPMSSPAVARGGGSSGAMPVGTAGPQPATVPSLVFATAAARASTANGTANGSGPVQGAPNGQPSNGSYGIPGQPRNGAPAPGPNGAASGPAGSFATAAATGAAPRPGAGYASGPPVSGGAFSGLSAQGDAVDRGRSGDGQGRKDDLLLDLTAHEGHTAPSNGAGASPAGGGPGPFSGANGYAGANGGGNGHNGNGANGHDGGWPIPPPPSPAPAEPVTARRVTASHHASVPAYNPIAPVPPPPEAPAVPPPAPTTGEEG